MSTHSSLFGLLNLHKPRGMTSRDVVNRVQRRIRPVKIGHAGTLDPLASGVLLLCVGPATRLVPRIQSFGKSYRAEFLLGRRSPTDDIEGEIEIIEEQPEIDRQTIAKLLPQFVGRIPQRPPEYSAVKIAGRRAYQLARAGRSMTMTEREVVIDRLELMAWASPRLTLEIDCHSGTYIRSIGRDLGIRLGCGAVMSALVRTRIGPFCLEEAWHLDQVADSRDSVEQALLSPVQAVPEVPVLSVSPEEETRIRNGQTIQVDESFPIDSGEIAVLSAAGRLVALGEIRPQGVFQPRQVFPI